ncbi:Lecithin:cholesterol acyltransferase [Devosia enhydra]|uniref:Lecithin:cholesterol acyltransferase n=1 Tax=Devosia enhydra TaxID=665118 RepID=A0A1K2HXQ8_9HYPH|nr:hypothetical protein [Devosia enhydra]SFZ84475.1 Lecithin:cholesterol acyltransferase [Devosia enhydra]
MGAFPDVVVLLPGILGSELTKDGKLLWGAGSIWDSVFNNGLARLQLTAPGSLDEDIGDGIVPRSILRWPALIPDFWKIGGYQELSYNLQDRLGLKKGKNFFEFPYDWRRDNRVAAIRLARESHDWLKAWREESGNAEAKLILIVHSMGGLIARHFVEVLEGWKATRATIAIATPFAGSGDALDFLQSGIKANFLPDGVKRSIYTFAGFDSLYQLLPTGPFLRDGAGSPVKLVDANLLKVDRNRVRSALAFHDEMRDAASTNKSIGAYLERKGATRTVIGSEQPTKVGGFVDDQGWVTFSGKSVQEGFLSGDGTVPRRSATPPEVGEEVAAFAPTSHSAITSYGSVMSHVCNAIAGMPETPLRDRGGVGTISLLVDDLYRAGADVAIRAATRQSAQFLNLTLTNLDDTKPPIKTRMNKVDDYYVWQYALPAGSYRASVEATGAEEASDIFTVVDVDLLP